MTCIASMVSYYFFEITFIYVRSVLKYSNSNKLHKYFDVYKTLSDFFGIKG